MLAAAQQTSTSPPAAPAGAPQQNPPKQQGHSTTPQKKNDRMFYVMPNYLTVENQAKVPPLTSKEKFKTTAEGTFDPYEFVINGVLAGIRQAHDAYPGYGEGLEGYGKRYGAAFADGVDENIMVGGVFPSILHTDPRYYQRSHGSFWHRVGYAVSRIAVTRTDSGRNVFNVSEFVGAGVAAGISNLYYPHSDASVDSTLTNWGAEIGVDAFGNQLKEFWPDIHRWIMKKRQKASATSQ